MIAWLVLALLGGDASRIANPPTSIEQYQSDGTTVIAQGGTVTGGSLVIRGYPSSTSSASASLRIEVKPVSQSFTNVYTQESIQVPNGTQASVTISGLAPGQYKWQAWSYCT